MTPDNLNDLSVIVWSVALGFCLSRYLHKRSARLPYRWVCQTDDCRFKIEGTDSMIVLRLSDKHEQDMHGGRG